VNVPEIDEATRRRLLARFGSEVEAWFAQLPGLLAAVSEQWGLAYDAPIPRGRTSVVVRCQLADGRRGVLKVSPDRARLAFEATALADWPSRQVPEVIAVDERLGALLLEAIEPGEPLAVSVAYPPIPTVGHLLHDLHTSGIPRPSYPRVEHRVRQLFDSSLRLYAWHPHLRGIIPVEVYERGRVLGLQLAHTTDTPMVLLHGDLTPNNIVDGGAGRGLVALDPCPCVGDAAFDAVDLLLWKTDDHQAIHLRAQQLAAATGAPLDRLLAWCTAFAAMVALELASEADPLPERVHLLLELATRAP
jgi:streptomycin 6-kinase